MNAPQFLRRKQEVAISQGSTLAEASPEVVAHFESAVRTERDLREARELIDRITHEADERENRMAATIAELRRENAFLRTELDTSSINRDTYHTRALAAETALRCAAAVLVDSIAEGNRTAAAQCQDAAEEPRGDVTAIDLDMTKHIAAKFGADNRDEQQQDDPAK
jgi:hypothetical protein